MVRFIVVGLILGFVATSHSQNIDWLKPTQSSEILLHQSVVSQNKVVKTQAKDGDGFLKSALVPGWGQYTSGRKKTAAIMFTTEVILWSTFFGMRKYADWLERDYKVFATQHAGTGDNMNHQFYVDIGSWMDRDSFNEKRLQDRAYNRLYTTEATYWQWDTDSNRRKFKDLRISSDKARQNSVLVIGAILFNHLGSAIDSGRDSASKKVTVTPNVDLDYTDVKYAIGLSIRLN